MELLSEKDRLEDIIMEEKLLLLQFGAEDCSPCRAIRHKLSLWLEGREGCRYIYIDTGRFPRASAQLGVFSVPTLCLYAEGKLYLRESGCFSLEEFFLKARRIYDMLKE